MCVTLCIRRNQPTNDELQSKLSCGINAAQQPVHNNNFMLLLISVAIRQTIVYPKWPRIKVGSQQHSSSGEMIVISFPSYEGAGQPTNRPTQFKSEWSGTLQNETPYKMHWDHGTWISSLWFINTKNAPANGTIFILWSCCCDLGDEPSMVFFFAFLSNSVDNLFYLSNVINHCKWTTASNATVESFIIFEAMKIRVTKI